MRSDVFKTTGEVARLLGIPRWKLSYLLDRGVLNEPELSVPGRRLFSEGDIARLKKHLCDQNEVSDSSNTEQSRTDTGDKSVRLEPEE